MPRAKLRLAVAMATNNKQLFVFIRETVVSDPFPLCEDGLWKMFRKIKSPFFIPLKTPCTKIIKLPATFRSNRYSIMKRPDYKTYNILE